MPASVELEFTLARWDAERHKVELRFSRPDSDADIRLARGGPFFAHFKLTKLRTLTDKPISMCQQDQI